MSEDPVRVLHVIASTRRGGAESRIMDLYRAMDRSKVQFDFLVHEETASSAADRALSAEELSAKRTRYDFDDEIESLGGRIYAMPSLRYLRSPRAFADYRAFAGRFFASHGREYRVVQGHMTSLAAVYLAEAKKSGVPVTVAHARSAGKDPGWKGVFTDILRLPLRRENYLVRNGDGVRVAAVDARFACSPEAAGAVFGRAPVRILPNAIDLEAYSFDPSVREQTRESLGLAGSTVIGHVGNFRYAKNHEFLLRVFDRLLHQTPGEDLRLLLVGGGTDLEKIRTLSQEMGLTEHVIFTGAKQDVIPYYQAMDIFAFPSRYEGLPGTVVEAQAAGLPCLISDRITKMVDATPLVVQEGIGTDGHTEEAEQQWVRQLQQLLRTRPERTGRIEEGLALFDVHAQAAELQKFYLEGRFS